jgi:hypothetical protein
MIISSEKSRCFRPSLRTLFIDASYRGRQLMPGSADSLCCGSSQNYSKAK